ncbi:MAG TPA: pitrilysin family protein [Candidatus Limnocylindrales bacterium]|nr:pitrilysin family protein [Candidatus Limnocylindrales bacterium]
MAISAPSLPNAQTITRVALSNGITVLVYPTFAAQSVVIAGHLRAGSLFEAPAQGGLASMTAFGLMRGTQHRDFFTLHDALEAIGADLGISASGHLASFSGKALAEDLPTLLDILADTLRAPAFPDAQIERLRGEIITGLKIRDQDTRYQANRLFDELLYPENHPYHHPLRGTLETVTTLTPAALRDFHARYYGPRGMNVAIVGAVDVDAAVEAVRTRFADWSNPDQPAPPALPEIPPASGVRRGLRTIAGKTQSDIALGVVGPSRFADDYQAAVIANSILGQFGMMGRIGASVREDLGLAYYAYSNIEGGLGPGAWSVMAGVNPANVDLAIGRIQDELRRLISEPVGAEDLADNQAYFTGRLPLQLESSEGVAGSILNMELYELGLDYLLNYRDLMMRLTADDLLAAARRYLDPERLAIGVAGPAS